MRTCVNRFPPARRDLLLLAAPVTWKLKQLTLTCDSLGWQLFNKAKGLESYMLSADQLYQHIMLLPCQTLCIHAHQLSVPLGHQLAGGGVQDLVMHGLSQCHVSTL